MRRFSQFLKYSKQAMKSYIHWVSVSESVIYRKFSGPVTLDEMYDSWMHILNMEEFTSMDFDLITDYTEAEILTHPRELNVVEEFYRKHLSLMKGSRHGVVTGKPKATALSQLFAENGDVTKEIGYKIFTTLDAAVKWLNEH